VSRRIRPSRDEAGATLVLVSLMLVFMFIIVAIVIDGGQGYTDRRSVQNAADAAALAGARAIGQTRFAGAPDADLETAVQAVATANGANAADVFLCEVVSPTLGVLGPCSNSASSSDAAGVRVTVGSRRTPVFGSIAGQRELVVRTSASATLQPLLASRAPWMICGNPVLAGGFNLIDPATRTLHPDATLRDRYGPDTGGIPVQGTLPGTCGLSGSWIGAVSPSAQPVRLGSFVAALNGAPSGAYAYDDILGSAGCQSNFADGASACNAALPIFDEIDPGANTVRIVAWAVWKLTYSSAGPVKWRANFVGAGIASGGVTSTAAVTGRSTYVVRIAS